jgi:AraC-like DNA-binding protein
MENEFGGSFDLYGMVVDYLRAFTPSPIARRSYLYLISLGSAYFPPTHYTVREGLRAYQLIESLEGAGRFTFEGRTYDVLPGDVLLYDCMRPHDARSASPEGWRTRWAYINGPAMADLFGQVMLGGSVKFAMGAESEFHRLFSQLYELNLREGGDREFLSNYILTGLMTELLKSVPQLLGKPLPRLIRDICAWLDEHCDERITLDEIAERFDVSKYHLCRLFKKHTGKTLFEYIVEAKIRSVKELLRYTDLKIAEISHLVGVEQQSYLCRIFQNTEGMSPSAYRKQWRGL